MTVMALKKNNMKKGPFKMKGDPMKRNFGISPVKLDNGNEEPSELIQDPEVDSGSQNRPDTSGYQQFKSVQRLKDLGAPKKVIQAERDKQMKLLEIKLDKERKNRERP